MPATADPTTEAKPKDKKKELTHPRDPAREVIETIVFVVVLVLLLKLFVTEAFVIPTGSMAETLYGYQKIVKCPKCGHEFPVNSHDEVEGRQGDGKRMALYGYCCPNCRHLGRIQDFPDSERPKNNTGDRVLVLKPLFHVRDPRRGDVVVFKYPEKPQDKFTAQNYIKRCMGFGGETVALHRGDMFVTRSLEYPPDMPDASGNEPQYPRPGDPLELWKPEYMYATTGVKGNPLAATLFDSSRGAGFPSGGGFEIVRKEEEQLLADLRTVWDNDQQPAELAGKVPPRWYARAGGWTGDNQHQPKVFGHDAAEQHWIGYRHLAMPWKTAGVDASDPTMPTLPAALAAQQPGPIDNFLGYNAGRSVDPGGGKADMRDHSGTDRLWVGDLCLECKANIGGGAEVVLELSKGVDRFRATFTEGTVTLSRVGPGGEKFGSPTRPCKFSAGKDHTLRFANIDCRLWVWVDGKRIDFGTEADYNPPTPEQEGSFKDGDTIGVQPEGWTKTNDVLAPAGIGAKGKATISAIKLTRDIYYTRKYPDSHPEQLSAEFHNRADIYYVQPGHYMCLGDNSAQSSDSRNWGVVPERLMLGKAVFVFWPAWPNNRVGFIK